MSLKTFREVNIDFLPATDGGEIIPCPLSRSAVLIQSYPSGTFNIYGAISLIGFLRFLRDPLCF